MDKSQFTPLRQPGQEPDDGYETLQYHSSGDANKVPENIRQSLNKLSKGIYLDPQAAHRVEFVHEGGTEHLAVCFRDAILLSEFSHAFFATLVEYFKPIVGKELQYGSGAWREADGLENLYTSALISSTYMRGLQFSFIADAIEAGFLTSLALLRSVAEAVERGSFGTEQESQEAKEHLKTQLEWTVEVLWQLAMSQPTTYQQIAQKSVPARSGRITYSELFYKVYRLARPLLPAGPCRAGKVFPNIVIIHQNTAQLEYAANYFASFSLPDSAVENSRITDPVQRSARVLESSGMKTCIVSRRAHPFGCMQCEKWARDNVDRRFKLCGSCKLATYCSRECQAAAWKAGHKQSCVGRNDGTAAFSSA